MDPRKFILIVFCAVICVILNHARPSFSKVLETEPASNEELLTMIDSLPNVLGNTTCLNSENCAKDWIDLYNKVTQKVYERQSILEVSTLISEILYLTQESNDCLI